MIVLGDKEYYKGIESIPFEGKESDNPLAFKYYNPDQVIAGKTMREHFKFAIAYWHTFCGQGGDPFGPGTQNFAWDASSDPVQKWGLIISAFMIMILFKRHQHLLNQKKDLLPLPSI